MEFYKQGIMVARDLGTQDRLSEIGRWLRDPIVSRLFPSFGGHYQRMLELTDLDTLYDAETYWFERSCYWREMYKNTAEALRKTQDALLAATDGE